MAGATKNVIRLHLIGIYPFSKCCFSCLNARELAIGSHAVRSSAPIHQLQGIRIKHLFCHICILTLLSST
jgi:hypothetical protein